ncbi:MAG: class I SAM-dependent methyltransferase [Elusimicrobia bacterium]|nr:class I SAM-dependent methyltransferase [Elusimicrobiota bacterium]
MNLFERGLSRLVSLARFPFIYRAWQAPLQMQKVKPLLADSTFHEARRILDVGCGPGTNTRLFKGRSYLGVDNSEQMIADARRRFGNCFVVGDVTQGAFIKQGPFDLILMNSLLHHLNDAELSAVLGHVRVSLAPQGVVHICDLVLPKKGLTRFFANIDRGRYARSLSEWEFLFCRTFSKVKFETYYLKLAGIFPIYQMVYFKGKAL